MFTVYVLQSLKDKRTYVGCTHNLENRIKEHNYGEVQSTKSRRPFKLIYKEVFWVNMKHSNGRSISRLLGVDANFGKF